VLFSPILQKVVDKKGECLYNIRIQKIKTGNKMSVQQMDLPVGRTYAVLFDTAETEFTHYTRYGWVAQVNEWASELEEEGFNVGNELGAVSYRDILDGMSGGEWFVTFIED